MLLTSFASLTSTTFFDTPRFYFNLTSLLRSFKCITFLFFLNLQDFRTYFLFYLIFYFLYFHFPNPILSVSLPILSSFTSYLNLFCHLFYSFSSLNSHDMSFRGRWHSLSHSLKTLPFSFYFFYMLFFSSSSRHY